MTIRPTTSLLPEQADELVRRTPPSGKKRSIGLLAVVATFGSLLFGYDTGVIAGALPYMYMPLAAGGLHLGAFEEGLVGGLLAIGAAFGAIIGGQLSDRYGRRHNILVLAVIFFVGTVGCTLAPNVFVLYPFRFILGWAVGGASATVPIYLAETAPQRIRGPLVAVDQFMIVAGQLLAYTMNAVLSNAHGGPQVQIQSDPTGTFAAGQWGRGTTHNASPAWWSRTGTERPGATCSSSPPSPPSPCGSGCG